MNKNAKKFGSNSVKFEVQLELELELSDTPELHGKYRSTFEELYLKTIFEYEKLIKITKSKCVRYIHRYMVMNIVKINLVILVLICQNRQL